MAVIGAGIAGITAGVLLPVKVPGIQLTIFDENNDVVCVEGNTDSLYCTNIHAREVPGLRTSTLGACAHVYLPDSPDKPTVAVPVTLLLMPTVGLSSPTPTGPLPMRVPTRS